MKKLYLFFTLLCSMVFTAVAEVETFWLSNAVVPGEQTRLFIIIPDGNVPLKTALPRVKGASLRWIGNGNYIRGYTAPNQTAFLVAIEVTPDEVGTVQIPSITLHSSNGRTYHTTPQLLHVYPYSAIKWNTARLNNNTGIRYGMLWHVDNHTPYVHQPDRCELKIYAPEHVRGYPALPTINTSNMASWRFEPPLIDLMGGRPHGKVLYKGANWNVITFTSMIFPLRAGELSASGSITAHAIMPEADPLIAAFSHNIISLEFIIPEFKIKAQELPTPAPSSFTNAVGHYRISATTEAQDLSANEPITVTVRVEGTGNIHSISAPTLTDAANWKLYPPNKLDPGLNTRSVQGTVEFQQMMRPISQTDAIPAFELSFFDPATQQYHTVRTNPIPLPWKASAITGAQVNTVANATPPPAGTVPVAEMTDIYGMAPVGIMAAFVTPIHPAWYFLAYIPAFIILCFALCRFLKARKQSNLWVRERMRAFKKLSPNTRQFTAADFLRSAGNFIESHIPANMQNDDIKNILRRRDEMAFRADTNDADLPAAERRNIIQTIKKILTKLPLIIAALMMTAALSFPSAMADDNTAELGVKAYEQGEYAKAIEAFDRIIADQALPATQRAYAYLGKGNALYRLNKPGLAALNYRRALQLSPLFTEAQLNLRFIERKQGAVLPSETAVDQWLTFVPFKAILPIAILAGAVMITILALFTITRKHGVLRTILATLCGLIVAAALTNYFMYPTTPDSVPADKVLVVTSRTNGLHAANEDSPAVIALPESTPLILRATRGSWYYANTFAGDPVWLPKNCAEKL